MTTKLLLTLAALAVLAGCGGLPYSDPYGASPETSA
jgi:ABC-type glycerol-3-phosphate transport system substrate-binding protein